MLAALIARLEVETCRQGPGRYRQPRHISAQALAKGVEIEMAAPLDGGALRFGVKPLGFKKVGVDQAGEQHPRQESVLEPFICTLRK
jgi:hypothetical protein